MIAVTRNRPEQAISILKGLGVRAGIPDIIARLTAVQRDAHAALSEAGATVETACGLDAALNVLERWGVLRGVASLSGRAD
jgi:hypothetical protein